MRLRIGPGRDENTLVLEGELDMAAVDRFTSAIELCSFPGGDLILECGLLAFIDGAGARALVEAAERLPVGSRLIVDHPSGLVLRVLQMLRVDKHPRLVVRPSLLSA
jgi:anti-anti-sigma regulatory factor